jgi:hypothetical protein
MRIDSFDLPCESQPALNTEILTPPGEEASFVGTILREVGWWLLTPGGNSIRDGECCLFSRYHC